MCNYLNNNIFMNYGGYQMGGYQYGMGIADLFSGVNGLNSVWNFNNCGFSNLGYGYGCCGNSNSQLGWGIGYTVTNVLGSIGLSWAASARTNRAAEKAAAREAARENAAKGTTEEQLHKQLTILNIDTDIDKLTEEEINDTPLSVEYQKAIDALTGKDGSITKAKAEVEDPTNGLTAWQNKLKATTDKISELKKTLTSDATHDKPINEQIETLKKTQTNQQEEVTRLENLKKSYEEGGELDQKLKAAEAAKKEAQKKLDAAKIEAKRLLKAYKAEQEEIKRQAAEKAEANFQDLADDADGCDWTINKKVKNYNNRYGEADETTGIRELKEGQSKDNDDLIDDLRAIAHLAMTAKPEDRIKYKNQFNNVMNSLLGGIDKLPDDLRRFYNQGLSQVK